MVTIVTSLRGDPALTERWAASVAARVIEAGVLAAVNNEQDMKIVQGLGGSAIVVKPYTGDEGDEVARVNYIADIYGELVKAAKTRLVMKLDDDVLPPFAGYQRLLETGLRRIGPGVAGVVTVYPHRDAAEFADLLWRPFEWGGAAMSSVPTTGEVRVWGGGTGFSLWRRDILLKTLPWSTQEQGGTVPGWNRDLAIKLHEMKAATYLDCSILSRHDSLPQ